MSEISNYSEPISTLSGALAALGVSESTLTAAERSSLLSDGFVLFKSLVDPEWLALLRLEYERLMEEKYGRWNPNMKPGTDSDFWNHEAGTRRLVDLVSESPVFDGIYTHPKLLASVAAVLGESFHLHSLNARDALPGHGHQALHTDGPPLLKGETSWIVNSAWILDDYTPENGATRVVPGTHRITGPIKEQVADPLAPHPKEQLMFAPAGSVLVFNSYVWHSGTQNRTQQPRRAINCAFSMREQLPVQSERIRKSTYERISQAARYILAV